MNSLKKGKRISKIPETRCQWVSSDKSKKGRRQLNLRVLSLDVSGKGRQMEKSQQPSLTSTVIRKDIASCGRAACEERIRPDISVRNECTFLWYHIYPITDVFVMRRRSSHLCDMRVLWRFLQKLFHRWQWDRIIHRASQRVTSCVAFCFPSTKSGSA